MSNRRDFVLTTLSAALSGVAVNSLATEQTPAEAKHDEAMNAMLPNWRGTEEIAMVIYPGFTALDLFGPHHMFVLMMGAKVHLVAESKDPVETDTKIFVQPTKTFEECPEKLTILFVPGGTVGTLAACENAKMREFLRNRGGKADWVSSVCTGSLLLGAAGLLKGYQATSHWLARNELSLFGATPVDKRVVIDRNRVTGAGVTAGIDFGLDLVQKLRGTPYAQAVQLFAEYDPQPGLDAGSEAKAPKNTVDLVRLMHMEFAAQIKATAERIKGA